jgi:hypothetical protein
MLSTHIANKPPSSPKMNDLVYAATLAPAVIASDWPSPKWNEDCIESMEIIISIGVGNIPHSVTGFYNMTAHEALPIEQGVPKSIYIFYKYHYERYTDRIERFLFEILMPLVLSSNGKKELR